MTATEPVQGGPYPLPADPPDGPNQMAAIVTWAAGRTVMRFATTAARDAALPTPTAGQLAYITGTGVLQFYSGSTWVAVAGTGAWQSPTIASGWSAVHATRPVQYRVVDGWCEMSGVLLRSAGIGAASNTLLLSGMPAVSTSGSEYPMIPVGMSQLGTGPVAGATGMVNIRADGALRVASTAAISSNAVVTLDGARYRIS